MTKYHYRECGLDSVIIDGLHTILDEEGDEVIEIPFVHALHVEIARGIISRNGNISGKELRFLRTEMGLTQAELAGKVNVEGQTVGRWERGETSLDSNAETVIRRLAGERLIEAFNQSIEELVRRIQSKDRHEDITIQAENDGYDGYRLLAA